MRQSLSFIFLLLLFTSIKAQDKSTRYSVIAHSHNDYEQKQPITTAIHHGFSSLEADIFFYNDQLIVSHTSFRLNKKIEFEKEYLVPLLNQLGDREVPIILLVDVKNYSERLITKLNDILGNYDSVLVKRDEAVRGKKIQIVLSGSVPREKLIADEANQYLFMDGRVEDLAFDWSEKYTPLISMNFTKLCKWNGEGRADYASLQKVKETIALVQSKGKKMRFWRTNDTGQMWMTLIALDVDIIGVDDIEKFYRQMKQHGMIK